MRKRWTESEVVLLKSAVNQKKSIGEICRILERGTPSVYGKLHNLGINWGYARGREAKRADVKERFWRFLEYYEGLRQVRPALRKAKLNYRTFQRIVNGNYKEGVYDSLKASYEDAYRRVHLKLKCSRCGEIKDRSEFYVKKKDKVFGVCKVCDARRLDLYKKTLRGKASRISIGTRQRDPDSDVTQEDIIEMWNQQGGCCYYTGKLLQIDTSEDRWAGISIDRLVPEKGYKKGNCVLCSLYANTAKNYKTIDEFLDFCRIVTQRFPNG